MDTERDVEALKRNREQDAAPAAEDPASSATPTQDGEPTAIDSVSSRPVKRNKKFVPSEKVRERTRAREEKRREKDWDRIKKANKKDGKSKAEKKANVWSFRGENHAALSQVKNEVWEGYYKVLDGAISARVLQARLTPGRVHAGHYPRCGVG